MATLKLGGVPEHFNFPIHLAIEDNLFKNEGVDVEWVEFPDGTGAMNKALRAGKIDAAIILTEGIIKDISAGNPSKIIQNYVKSPLIWGIHVAASSAFKSIDDLESARIAISRFGSGSHLMAFVHAQDKGWDTTKLKFVEVGTLENAIEALTTHEADYFMWEHFTTKPIVDKGIFRNVGDFPTPWSSFVIAAREEYIDSKNEALYSFLKVVNLVTADFKKIPSIDRTLSNRYNQQLNDVKKWLSLTTWSQHQINIQEVDLAQNRLLDLNMVDEHHENDFYLTKI